MHSSYSVKLIASVFTRIETVPSWGWIGAVIVGMVSVMVRDVLFGILVLLMVSHALDWFYGRAAAKVRKEFAIDRSLAGLQSKIAGIALILLVRAFEAWLHVFSMTAHAAGEYVNTKGFVATAVAVALFANDIESISDHREAMGAKPIPVLSSIIRGMRKLANAVLPKGMQGEADA